MLKFLFGKSSVKRKARKVAPVKRKAAPKESTASKYLKLAIQNAPSIAAAAGLVGTAIVAAKNKKQIKESVDSAIAATGGSQAAIRQMVSMAISQAQDSPGKISAMLDEVFAKLKSSPAAASDIAKVAMEKARAQGPIAMAAVNSAIAKAGLGGYTTLPPGSTPFPSEFGKRRHRVTKRRVRVKGIRKPPAKLLRLCKKYKIKVTIKRGRKRVYKSAAVLKKLLRKRMRRFKR